MPSTQKTPFSIALKEEQTILVGRGQRTPICPRDAANIVPVFVSENPSKKIVVTLYRAPDSTRIQRTSSLDLQILFRAEFHLMPAGFQNR